MTTIPKPTTRCREITQTFHGRTVTKGTTKMVDKGVTIKDNTPIRISKVEGQDNNKSKVVGEAMDARRA